MFRRVVRAPKRAARSTSRATQKTLLAKRTYSEEAQPGGTVSPLKWPGINRVILAGAVGTPAKITKFSEGFTVANLNIATNDTTYDDQGNPVQTTEWHKVVIRQTKAAEYIEKNISVGARVYIEGRLRSRKYKDPQGQERYISEVVVFPKTGQFTLLKASPKPVANVVTEIPARAKPSDTADE